MIDDKKDAQFISKLGFPTIGYYEMSQDADFHDFIIKIFNTTFGNCKCSRTAWNV